MLRRCRNSWATAADHTRVRASAVFLRVWLHADSCSAPFTIGQNRPVPRCARPSYAAVPRPAGFPSRAAPPRSGLRPRPAFASACSERARRVLEILERVVGGYVAPVEEAPAS